MNCNSFSTKTSLSGLHRLRKGFFGTCASVGLIAALAPAYADSVLDFAGSGSLAEWTSTGSVATTNVSVTLPLGPTQKPFTLTPAAGEYMAAITPSDDMSLPVSNIDSRLGLATGTIDSVLDKVSGGDKATHFAVLTKAATLAAGTYTFYWSYAAQDYQPYNDGVLFSLSGNGVNLVDVLACNGPDGPQAGTDVVGDYGATQWAAATFTVAQSGTYELGFAAYNWMDNSLSPILFVGDAAGTVTSPGSSTPIDTNASYYLASKLGSTVNADFEGGTLRIDSAMTIASNFNVGTPSGSFVDAYGNAAVFSGVLSGVGSLVFTDSVGGGVITLGGANTYQGLTGIRGVTLRAGAVDALPSTTILVMDDVAGSVFDLAGFDQTITSLSGSGTVMLGGATLTVGYGGTFAGAITGDGSVAVNGGTLFLTGTNTYTGATTVASGATLVIGTGGTTGSIVGDVVDNGALVFDLSGASTYGGEISGNGTLVVTGGGKVVLNGANTYAGPTTVTNATLIIGDATHTAASVTSDVTVGTGGVVGGHGTIHGNLTASGGTVSPGNSLGTLSVTGNYIQSGNSTLAIEVAPTQNDRLAVGGTATLDGTLAISLDAGTYTSAVAPVLTANSVNGKFASVTFNGAASDMVYGISYAPKEVDLVMAPKTAGEVYGDIVTASIDTAIMLNRTVLDRPETTGVSGLNVWARPLSGASLTLGANSSADFSTQLWGAMGGADYLFAGGTRLSGVFGYTHSQLGVDGRNTKAATDGYYYSLAAHLPVVGFSIDVSGFAVDNGVSVTRDAGAVGRAKGDADNLVGGGSFQIGYRLGNVLPFARVTVASLHADGFNETGAGALALNVDKASRTAVRGTWGVEADRSYTTASGVVLMSRVTIGMENEFGPTGRDLNMSLAGTPFVAPAPAPEPVSGIVGAALAAKLGDKLDLNISADGRMSANQREGILSVGAQYRF